jgi:hypothetical protein
MSFDQLYFQANPAVTALHPSRLVYAQDANMTVVLYDLSSQDPTLKGLHPSHVLLLPVDAVCHISALHFSSDGRYLFAACIAPVEKQVHLLAWDLA